MEGSFCHLLGEPPFYVTETTNKTVTKNGGSLLLISCRDPPSILKKSLEIKNNDLNTVIIINNYH